jgi:polar amino acid transport system substrate-binding protein
MRWDVQIRRYWQHICAIPMLMLCALSCIGAQAQTCGMDYIVREGDSLTQIAARAYGKPWQWAIIFYANQDRLGSNASLMVPGLAIRIPCLSGEGREGRSNVATTEATLPPPRPASLVLSTMVNRIEFLTADGEAPFTGRSLSNGGMLTHILSTAMNLITEESRGRFNYGVSWVNDWSAHLSPLLVMRTFDVGFPWSRPDCENALSLDHESKLQCQRFFFSDPLQEVLTLAFVRKDSPIDPSRDDDIIGRTVCRPTKYGIFELDQGGRNWVKDGKITLIRAQSTEECFRLLDAGSVEVVIASDLAARAEISNLGIVDRVRISDRPIAISTLHAIVAKTHPNSRTILYYINTAVGRLKESGDYDRIVEEHLQRFWESVGGEPNTGKSPASTAELPAAGLTNTASVNRPDPQAILVPVALTTTEGDGRNIGVIRAYNARVTIGVREETALMLELDLEGLPPGAHAFHIHANPNCRPGEENGQLVPGLAAGPHLFLKGTGHEEGITYLSHLGNLPQLMVTADGRAKQQIAVPRLTLADIHGRSLVIHATADDLSTRQACGVVL